MRATLSVGLIAGGMACLTYWALFMSWSHSFASYSFQHRERLVVGIGVAAVVAGTFVGVRALAQWVASSRHARDR